MSKPACADSEYRSPIPWLSTVHIKGDTHLTTTTDMTSYYYEGIMATFHVHTPSKHSKDPEHHTGSYSRTHPGHHHQSLSSGRFGL